MFLEFFLVLYAIVIIGILLLTWVIKKMGYERLSKNLRKYLLIITGTLIAVFHIYDWQSRHHYYQFDLGDQYTIDLELIEYDSFLDYPVDLKFEIEDKDTHETFYFEISSGNGPYFEFLSSENHPDIILILGVDKNEGISYRMDLVNKTVDQNYASAKDTSEFKVFAEFTYELKLLVK